MARRSLVASTGSLECDYWAQKYMECTAFYSNRSSWWTRCTFLKLADSRVWCAWSAISSQGRKRGWKWSWRSWNSSSRWARKHLRGPWRGLAYLAVPSETPTPRTHWTWSLAIDQSSRCCHSQTSLASNHRATDQRVNLSFLAPIARQSLDRNLRFQIRPFC